jgi:hypothetical protein
MSMHDEPPSSPARSPSRTLHQLQSIRTNIRTGHTAETTHVSGESTFINAYGDIPGCIDPSTNIRISTQNVQGVKPVKDDVKLQSGIDSMVSLKSGITRVGLKTWCLCNQV